MSGGHWAYLAYNKLEDATIDRARECVRLLAALEHELDWGFCGDTCLECARLRMAPALEVFFDYSADQADAAIAVARDVEQNQCERCAERRKGDGGQNHG